MDIGTGVAVGTGSLALLTSLGSLILNMRKAVDANLLRSTALAQSINTGTMTSQQEQIRLLQEEVRSCESDKEILKERVVVLESLFRK